MSRSITEKNIKIHVRNEETDSVDDTRAGIPYRTLKALKARKRIYKDTKETFFLIESDCELSL